MKQAMRPSSRATWGADLPVGGQPVAGSQGVVKHEVDLELARRVLVVTLNHVETHGLTIRDDPGVDARQFLELVDVVGERLGRPAVRPAVFAAPEPGHFRFTAMSKVESVMVCHELLMDAPQVAAAILLHESARIGSFLAGMEDRAVDARGLPVPGQLAERLGIGDRYQFMGIGRKSEEVARAIGKDIGEAAVPCLDSPGGHGFPVRRRHGPCP